MNIQEIINLWSKELEQNHKAFLDQALQVRKWDELLLANGKKVMKLKEQVRKVSIVQHNLKRIIE
ncbi:hypothetical protein GN156_36655, partial [bacterium LRH843]|nr:hypothetical protein [bacterium LRH843]